MGRLPPGARALLAGAAALALLVGAYGLWWRHVARSVEAALPEAVADLAAAGIAADPGAVAVGGFPYRIEVELLAPSLAGDGWAWRPERIQVFIQPWNLRHFVALAPGGHGIEIGDRRTSYAVETARASAVFDRAGEPVRASAEARGVAVRGEGPARGADMLEAHARRRDGGLDLALRARAVRLANGESPLGGVLDAFLAEARAKPYAGVADLRDPARWAEAGGVVEVTRTEAGWGPLQGVADGTVTLDGGGRPLGAFTVSAAGYGAALRNLAAAGLVDGAVATGIEILLDATTGVREDGTRAVRTPVTLQDGTLSVAGIPLLRLPALSPGGRR